MIKKYKTHSEYTSIYDIEEAKSHYPKELLKYFESKKLCVASSIPINDFAQKCLFEKAFELGYFAAFTVSDNEEDTELRLTPLAKAMEEE